MGGGTKAVLPLFPQPRLSCSKTMAAFTGRAQSSEEILPFPELEAHLRLETM